MNFLVKRILLALVISAMAAGLALGAKRETVTFPEDVKLNGTLVKKGTYDLSFDDKTNELAILKHGKVIAKTAGSLEKRSDKARRTEYRTATGSDGTQITRVAFSGSDQDIVVASSAARN